MQAIHPQYITDNFGKKLSVILPIKEYQTLLDELENAEDIRLYDAAKLLNESSIPIDEAFEIIENLRKK